jgi:hypothetical protein
MLNKGSDVRNHLSSAHKAHLVTSPSEHSRDVDLKANDSRPESGSLIPRPLDEQREANAGSQTK